MLWRKVGKILLVACGGLFCLIGVLMLGIKLALDRVPEYQAELKEWVHQRVGYHIAFAHVSPALRWSGPELYFDRLELRSKDDERVLARAAGGRIGANVWELMQTGKLLAGRIELDEPTIFVTRLGETDFALASELKLGQGPAALPPLTLRDLPVGTLAIRDGVITILNWNASLPELQLRGVNLNILRSGDLIELKTAARLPAVLGGELSLNGTARGAGPLRGLDWTALARARHLTLPGWHQLLPTTLARLSSGAGGFEMAARGHGVELTRADLDFDATNVEMQLAEQPAVKFEQIAGALTMTHSGDRWQLFGRRLRALSGGRRDPESEFDASWRGDDAGLLDFHARASYLRIETLLPLAGLLPQKDLREQLQEIAPTGEWLNTRVNLYRQATADPWGFDVQARFRGVGFAPVGRAPGLRGLHGLIAGNDSGGRVELDGPDAVFAWPQQLPQPVMFKTFKTTLYWQRTRQQLLIATPSIDIANPDAKVHLRLAWLQPGDDSSPVLTLAGAVDDGRVEDTLDYLPRTWVAPSALNWLDHALVAGRLAHADVVIRGPIRHFPFRDRSGLFLARARLEGLTLNYHDGWPVAEELKMRADFRNEGLSVGLQAARIGGLHLQRGTARFVDFKTGELRVSVGLTGDAEAAIDYLRASPLDAASEHLFSGVEGQGPIQADVDLYLPFKEFDKRHILVHTNLRGVSLNRVGGSVAATDLHGVAETDGAQVARADVRGKILGGYFDMEAHWPRNEPVTRTQLQFAGTVSGEALHAAMGLPPAMGLGGSAEWHGVLRIVPEPARERSLHITSTLAGLELALPEPLAKPKGTPLPSSLDVSWPAVGGTQIRMSLGNVVHGQLTMEPDVSGQQLGRAAVTFGAGADSAFSDSQVVNSGGVIDRLDLAGWLKLYTPGPSSKPLGSFLRTAKFQVGEIDYLGLAFHDVGIQLDALEKAWRIGVDGPNVVGSILLPTGANAGDPWQLEFERLKFVEGPGLDAAKGDAGTAAGDAGTAAGDAGTAAGDASANPRWIPAINFHAANLVWDERQFGDVRATLSKLDDGIGMQDLQVRGVGFSATATGEWRGKGVGLGRIVGSVVSTDVGETLKQLGYADLIEAKSGKMDADLKWVGAPTAQAMRAVTGHVELVLDKGQITGLKPGAGRLIGLTSLAALPRRLSLDFSDLTDKGFAFDTVRGNFDLHGGSAYTDDVVVKGPAGSIGLIGRVGFTARDYDQTAVVTGNVSSTLPLAAFVGGPVIGGAVLVFTQVFKQPLEGLTRGYYRITGSWDNPTVERIKSADAAAASAEAPKAWEK
jgi:uncharacterized protein (TIGR02099 family)